MARRTDVDLSTIHMSLWKANAEYYYIESNHYYLPWFFWKKYNRSSLINDFPQQIKVIKKNSNNDNNSIEKRNLFSVIFYWLAGLNFFIDIHSDQLQLIYCSNYW